MLRPVFCGNFEYETRQSDLERLFSKYGRIERIDMKSGFLLKENELLVWLAIFSTIKNSNAKAINLLARFAFVYFEDERDAEDAIRGVDNLPFGYDRRRLSVEWARGERGRHHDGKGASNQRPTKTLFVINFDPIRTRERDIERHFEPYGKVNNVRIRRNFAFVQFETQEEATKALECTHMSKILDRVVSVEYALRDDDERGAGGGGGGGGGGGRYDSPPRRDYGRNDSPYRRSPSPRYRRNRMSPDYRRARSPVYEKYNGPYVRGRSPDGPSFGGRARSPEYVRYRR